MKYRTIYQIIQAVVIKSFSLAGYQTLFFEKNDKCDRVVFDRNTLSLYFGREKNRRMKLYFEGLRRARGESSDNFSKQLRYYSLQQILEHALRKGLDGEVAECGVWRGHSAYIIAKILSENGFKNNLHIFDSFEEGLSEKMPEDRNERFALTAEQIGREKEMFSSTEEEVRKTLSDFDFVRFYKGWIPERFDEVKDCQFSFVHIDVDLYQPTLDSLMFFYPRLVDGGGLQVDDCGLTQFPGCKKAVEKFLSENRCSFYYEIPIGGCFILK